MKRAFVFSFFSALWMLSADPQAQIQPSKLSPHLQMLVSGDPKLVDAARLFLPVKRGPRRPQATVGAFVRFEGDVDALRASFASYGASIHTVAGDLATAEIPIKALEQVASLPNVIHIEESQRLRLASDVSVPATGANQVWYGANGPVAGGTTASRGAMPPPVPDASGKASLWYGNTGQHVVVGIVDTGIDLTNKDFIDSHGNTRILSLWDQVTEKGTPNPPAPFPAPGTPTYTGNECTRAQIDAVRQKTDLATSNSYDSTVSVLLQNAGGFAAADAVATGHFAAATAAADFDLDGNVDLVTGNLDGTITLLKGNGHGSFTPQAPIAVASNQQITAIAVGDFNHDGFPDLVAVVNTANQIALMLGNGDGTFQRPGVRPGHPTSSFLNVGNGPTSVALGDLDGDGNLDIVVTNYYDGTLSVLLGDGRGNFTLPAGYPFAVSKTANSYPQGAFPSSVAIGDFNGDGIPDLAVASWGRSGSSGVGADLSILLGNGDGTFTLLDPIDTSHFEMVVAVGDFNRDGKQDLALESYSGEVTVLLGNGDGTFKSPADYDAGGTAGLDAGEATLVVGDFDGDGILDVANLVRNSTNGSYYDGVGVLLGIGDGTFGAPTVYPTGSGNSTGLAMGNFHSSVCTEVDLDGHGTNVAGIAAGNGSAGGGGANQTPYRYMGMAPQADLVIVKTTMDDQDIVDGVAYIESKASAAGEPAVINLSLGGQMGPHDGTSDLDKMLSYLTGGGNIVVAAMGNDGGSRRHADGVVANGATVTIGFSVPAGITDEFDFDIWYPGQDLLGVNVIDPNGLQCMPAPEYSGSGSLVNFPGGDCGTGGITSFPVNPDNSDHEVKIQMAGGMPTGNWSITLTGSGCGASPCVAQGSFDIWLTRTCGTSGCVALTSSVDKLKSIDEPGTATNLIAVGSYATKNAWISRNSVGGVPTQSASTGPLTGISGFSGLGPTRNCSAGCLPVQKPDVAAPGEEIMSSYAAGAATGSCGIAGGACMDPDGQHIVYQGTSQATPHVTGAVALLLAQNPDLSPCQVKASLWNARANPNGNTGAVPNNYWGYGQLAIDLAIAAPPAPSVVIPKVVGLTLQAAQAAIASASLSLGAIAYAGSAAVPVGSVIAQNPPAGAGCAIPVRLTISGIAVPNVVGDTQAAASTAITGVNLTVGRITLATSATVPAGEVIGTNPAGGAYVAAGSAVDLTIAGVPVPDVTGETKGAAQSAIVGAGLAVGTITYAASRTVPVNSVISEDPAAGTLVSLGTTVNLVLSGIPVPNVVGQAQAAGEAVVTAANLTVGNVTLAASATVPAGDIVSQSPEAGTCVDAGSAVNLTVVGVVIPGVVGQAINTAETAITAVGLSAGSVTLAVSATVPVGVVISQSPAVGNLVAAGTAVDLVVSTGSSSAQVKVPNVVGMTQANATTAIGNAALVVGTVTALASTTVAAGSVIGENPVGGTLVDVGSAVNLAVSAGPPRAVPDVRGKTQADAIAALQAAGLAAGPTVTAASSTVPAGSVVNQSPPAGAQVGGGTAIYFVVSSGPPTSAAVVNPENPTVVAGQTKLFGEALTDAPEVISMAIGDAYTCALFTDGTVECWGWNSYGTLGNGTRTDSLTPVKVTGVSGAVAIAAGGVTACALLSDGTIKCWGSNRTGQLGNGDTNAYLNGGYSTTPVAVMGITNAMALSVSDSYFAQGYVCALLADQTVKCWGDNSFGELAAASSGPQKCGGIPCSASPLAIGGIAGAIGIVATWNQASALLADGTVEVWGAGLGAPSTSLQIPGATAISAIVDDSQCVLLAGGGVKCWGNQQFGALGNGQSTGYSTTPGPVSGIATATALAVSGYWGCALLSDGAVQCWGHNTDGFLGIGAASLEADTPVAVGGLTNATKIFAGDDNACALVLGGAVQCWGLNNTGAVGTGSKTGPQDCFGFPCAAAPATVPGLTAAPPVTWSSSNPTVATIDSHTGLLTALSGGIVTITATSASGTGSTSLTVTPPALSKCDATGDGTTNVADMQSVINEALGTALPVNDLNGDSAVNVVDVQIAANAVLKLGCAPDVVSTTMGSSRKSASMR